MMNFEVLSMKEFLDALQTGGPWTVVLAMFYVVKHLHDKRDQDRAKYDDDKQKLNDRLIAMSETQNDVLEKATVNQALLLDMVERAQQHKARALRGE